MKQILFKLSAWLDYLGGVSDDPPCGGRGLQSALIMALWWGVLSGLITLFCGQTSRFIYIDF